MLAEEMKYFAEYLSDASSAEDIDISVHCDVKIFTWLINYVKLKHNVPATGDAGPPTLSTKNVVSILISSDFLKMDHLVELCIKFCHDHLNVILKGPTNMACITNKLLTRLTEKFSHSELAHIKVRARASAHASRCVGKTSRWLAGREGPMRWAALLQADRKGGDGATP